MARNIQPGGGAKPRISRIAAVVLAALVSAGVAACDDAASTPEEFLARGEAFREQGKLQASVIELKNALQAEPGNARARRLLGLNALDLGQWVAAEALLERAQRDGAEPYLIMRPLARAKLALGKPEQVLEIARVGDDMRAELKADVLVLRGHALAGLGKPTEATKAYEEALGVDQRSFGAHLGFAGLAVTAGNANEARKRIAIAAKIASDASDVVLMRASFALYAGEFDAAVEAYQRLIRMRPERIDHWLGLARAQIGAGHYQEAIKSLELPLKEAPNHPRVNFLRSLAAYHVKDYEGSTQYAERVLAVSRSHLPTIMVAGAANYALGRYDLAANNLQSVVAMAPTSSLARRLLGATQLQLRRAKEAVGTLKPVADQKDADAELLQLVGVAAVRAGELDVGSSYLERAAGLEPRNPRILADLGQTRVALGQVDKGIEDLSKAVEVDPSLPQVDVALILNLLRAKRYAEALETARQFQQKRPEIAAGYTFAALAHIGLNDLGRAAELLRKALQVEPGNFDAARNLAILAIRERKFSEARDHLKDVLAHHDGHLSALLMLADLEVRQKRPAAAIRWYEEAIEKNSEVLLPRLHLGRWYLTSGSPEKALAVIQPALARFKTDPSLLELRGKAQIAMRNYSDAAVSFRELIEMRPDAAEAHYLLALAHSGLGQTEQMRNELTRAVELAPKHHEARLALTRLQVRLNDLDAAQRNLATLRQANAENPELEAIEGDLRSRQGRHRDAAEAYNRAMLKAGQTSSLMTRLASAQWASGQKDAAVSTLEQWIKARPASNEARLQLGMYHRSEGRLEEARLHLAELARRIPGNWVAHNELALVLLGLSDTDGALTVARRARDLAPDNPLVLDTLGLVHIRRNEGQDALILLQRASRRLPNNREIAFNLARAYHLTGQSNEAREVLKGILRDSQPFGVRAEAEALLKELGG